MNLALYARVARRFQGLLMVFVVAACLAAAVTLVDVHFDSTPHFSWRQRPAYASHVTLLVTQAGFPWGSAVQTYTGSKQTPAANGDLARLAALSNIYIELVNSDVIKRKATVQPGISDRVSASPSFAQLPQTFQGTNLPTQLPVVLIKATADTRQAARQAADAWAQALRQYVLARQKQSRIPAAHRTILQTLDSAKLGTEMSNKKISLAVVAFLGVLVLGLAIAFALESLFPSAPRPASRPPWAYDEPSDG